MKPQAPRAVEVGDRSCVARAFWCAAVFIGALAMRSPHLFSSPRFWAEEATEYYSSLQNTSSWNVFTLVVRGNFQLLTNLFSYLSTLVPARWAPSVTTYLALIVSVVFAALTGVFSSQRRWPLYRALVVVILFALLPQGYEIYLNTTNVQWVCALCVLMLCLIELNHVSTGWRWLFYVFVGAFGLTGVPSVLLTPAFLIRRLYAPSREHFRIGLILGTCALIQLAVIATHKHPDRHLLLNGYAMVMSWILQTMLASLLTIDAVNEISKHVQPPVDFGILLLVVITGLSVWGITARAALRSLESRFIAVILIVLWIVVPCIQMIAAFGNPMDYLSGGVGGRYFMLGSVSFVVLLALTEGTVASKLLLAVMLSATTYQGFYASHWADLVTRGPSWVDQLAACKDKRPCEVTVWPGPSVKIMGK